MVKLDDTYAVKYTGVTLKMPDGEVASHVNSGPKRRTGGHIIVRKPKNIGTLSNPKRKGIKAKRKELIKRTKDKILNIAELMRQWEGNVLFVVRRSRRIRPSGLSLKTRPAKK